MAFSSGIEVAEQNVNSSPALSSAEKLSIASEKEVSVIDEKNIVRVESKELLSIQEPTAGLRTTKEIYITRGKRVGAILIKFARFTGPGTLPSVAYVDPNNYQAAIDSGAQFEYKLLCILLLGVLMAAYLQVCLPL
jgi:metal iron transporter